MKQTAIFTPIAHIISWVFHPISMPILIFLVTLVLSPPDVSRYSAAGQGYLALVIGLFSWVLPGVFLWILYRSGVVPSLVLTERKHRTLPYIVGIMSMVVLYYKLRNSHVAVVVYAPILGGAVVGFGLLCINFFYKISAHAACAAAVLGFLLGGAQYFSYMQPLNNCAVVVAATVLAGLVGSARLYINAHTPAQVWCGYVLGGGLMYVVMVFN